MKKLIQEEEWYEYLFRRRLFFSHSPKQTFFQNLRNYTVSFQAGAAPRSSVRMLFEVKETNGLI